MMFDDPFADPLFSTFVQTVPRIAQILPRTRILPISNALVVRGASVSLPAQPQVPTKIVGFDHAPFLGKAIVRCAIIGPEAFFDCRGADYTVSDFRQMMEKISVREVLPGEKITLMVDFSWHPKSWGPVEREFRCWWVTKEMS